MSGVKNKKDLATLPEKRSSVVPRQHLITYSRVRPYECLVCHKGFVCADSLKNHVCIQPEGKPPREMVWVDLKRYGNEPKRYFPKSGLCRSYGPATCEICGQEFAFHYKLRVHLLKHTGEKPHICEFCSERFPNVWHLKNHLRSHTGEKPYQCLKCSKVFVVNRSLKRHIQRFHEEGRQFHCNVCNKAFSTMQQLKYHHTTHAKIQKYLCVVCKKRFVSKATYIRHKKIHPQKRRSSAVKTDLKKDQPSSSRA